MLIYFKYGFINFIKAVHEKEPAQNENEEPRDVLVDYYLKDLKENMTKNFGKGKIIAICGKIASGKTYYANTIKEKENAVILNTDELTYSMFDNKQGEKYTELSERANEYLSKKAVEIAKAGCNVILDWGFWNKIIRKNTTEYFNSKNINIEWHYIDIDDLSWKENIKERNKKIENGENKTDFYVTDGLKQKLLENWEIPNKEEIDIWYKFNRG
jgi:predicted kinase